MSVNNVNYAIQPDLNLAQIPVTGTQQLYIWECVNNSCRWDGPYSVTVGSNYLVINKGGGDLTLKLLAANASVVKVLNGDTYPYGITVSVDGQYYAIPTQKTIWIPVIGSSSLYVWECPSSGCRWDGPYGITGGYNYKIISYGGGNVGLVGN